MEHVAKRSADNRQRLFSSLNILQRKNIMVTAELLIQILTWKESGKKRCDGQQILATR